MELFQSLRIYNSKTINVNNDVIKKESFLDEGVINGYTMLLSPRKSKRAVKVTVWWLVFDPVSCISSVGFGRREEMKKCIIVSEPKLYAVECGNVAIELESTVYALNYGQFFN